MSLTEHEVEIRTGRRDNDGLIRLSVFMEDLFALTLEGHGERAPTLLLTIEQAGRLQSALSELIARSEKASGQQSQPKAGEWLGEERRRLAS